MTQTSLSRWLRIIIIGVALCGLFIYAWVFPALGKAVVQSYPEFSYCYYPWLMLLWGTGIPCYVAMVFAWRIAGNIGADHSFTLENGRLLKWISMLAALDAVVLFVMNIIYLFLNMNHPGVALLVLLVVFTGFAISVICGGLSHLVNKAAVLQEESDWTI